MFWKFTYILAWLAKFLEITSLIWKQIYFGIQGESSLNQELSVSSENERLVLFLH